MPFDPEDEDTKAALAKAIADATKPLADAKAAILNEKKQLADEVKALKTSWGDLDPEKVKLIMSRLENDEDTKLIAEGKVDEVINRRVTSLKGDYEKRLEAASKALGEKDEALKKRDSRLRDLVVESHIRQKATDLNLVGTAVDDALFRAKSIFTLDKDERVVAVDNDGHVRLGKDGKSPFSPSEWLEGMKEAAPHWFAAPSGGGAQGGGGSGRQGGGFVLSRADARDPAKYRAAKEQAAKAGGEVQIAAE